MLIPVPRQSGMERASHRDLRVWVALQLLFDNGRRVNVASNERERLPAVQCMLIWSLPRWKGVTYHQTAEVASCKGRVTHLVAHVHLRLSVDVACVSTYLGNLLSLSSLPSHLVALTMAARRRPPPLPLPYMISSSHPTCLCIDSRLGRLCTLTHLRLNTLFSTSSSSRAEEVRQTFALL